MGHAKVFAIDVTVQDIHMSFIVKVRNNKNPVRQQHLTEFVNVHINNTFCITRHRAFYD